MANQMIANRWAGREAHDIVDARGDAGGRQLASKARITPKCGVTVTDNVAWRYTDRSVDERAVAWRAGGAYGMRHELYTSRKLALGLFAK